MAAIGGLLLLEILSLSCQLTFQSHSALIAVAITAPFKVRLSGIRD
jgi:hypothetical protein